MFTSSVLVILAPFVPLSRVHSTYMSDLRLWVHMYSWNHKTRSPFVLTTITSQTQHAHLVGYVDTFLFTRCFAEKLSGFNCVRTRGEGTFRDCKRLCLACATSRKCVLRVVSLDCSGKSFSHLARGSMIRLYW